MHISNQVKATPQEMKDKQEKKIYKNIHAL